jgi:dTDP-4-dehydrorhamnose reductase
MKVAVTGATGRLGRALVAVLDDPVPWGRDEFDLDHPQSPGEQLDRARIEAVIHAAAWTDVDGCARDPDRALRRNGVASGVLARACADRGLPMILVSTNEVFDGRRIDGRGYGPHDEPRPINPYGASKLAGERAAIEAYGGSPGELGIVRTAWLYGPPGNDFPAKILAAGRRAAGEGQRLRVVGDEVGSPTYSADLAPAIAGLLRSQRRGGTHHVVNGGSASRAGWAREVFRLSGLGVEIDEVPASTWQRASTPPLWAVLEDRAGEALRPWQQALADYLPVLVG